MAGNLKKIGYVVSPCCRLCDHSHFAIDALWGTCSNYEYEHLKHTGPKRELSIFKFGRCSAFVASAYSIQVLGAHSEFFDAKQ